MELLAQGVILTLAIVWSLGLSLLVLAAIVDRMLAQCSLPAAQTVPAQPKAHVWLRPLHRKPSRA